MCELAAAQSWVCVCESWAHGKWLLDQDWLCFVSFLFTAAYNFINYITDSFLNYKGLFEKIHNQVRYNTNIFLP